MTENTNQNDANKGEVTPSQSESTTEVVGSKSESTPEVNPAAIAEKKQKDLTQLVYILQAISLAVGLTAIAGVILNYLKRDEVTGTYLEAHFRWQIKTFWYALGGVILGWLLAIVLVGFLILAVTGLWYIYRIVKGWLALNDGKEP